jgi:hypothetical protein
MDHLLLQCHFLRTVWFRILWPLGWQNFLPSTTATVQGWWLEAADNVPVSTGKEFNSLCLLVMKGIWLERNAHIDGRAADVAADSSGIAPERQEWVQYRRIGRLQPQVH